MTTKLFVYGLLKVPRIQQQLFHRNVEFEFTTIKGYSLSNNLVNGLYKTITPDCDGETEGVTLLLEDDELITTDRFESVSAGLYKRILLEDGIWVYIKGDDF